MNTDTQTQNAGGNDVVARIINVIATEVLFRVESRINEQLISLSNRITKLETEMGKSPSLDHLDDFVSLNKFHGLCVRVDDLYRNLEDAEYKIRDLEDDKVSSDDLDDSIRDAIDSMQDRQDAEAIVREGLKAIIDGKI